MSRRKSKTKPKVESHEPPAKTTHRLSRSRKLLFASVTTVASFGLLELVLWVSGVQPAWVTEDPYAGFSRHIPHFVESPDSSDQMLMTVSPSKSEVLNPQEFAAAKPEGVYRIVCLGGSTTYGRPFFDQTSFPGWLRELLKAAQPSRRWEVINAGGISYASYRALGVMEELAEYEPDLFVVYTGQNEFLERRTYDDWSVSRSLAGPLSLLYRTRTATVVRDVLDLAGLRDSQPDDRTAELGEDTKSIPVDAVGPDAYRRDPELNDEIVEHFKATLDNMVQVAKRSGADIVFVVPASNLADFAPFKSQHRDGISDKDLAEWKRNESRARFRISQGKHESALDAIKTAEALDDRFAGLWFLKGQALQALNRFDEAREAFLRAREEDVCPLRAIDPLVQVVRRMNETTGSRVVDFEQIAETNSEHGIPGKSLFHDHVHPTVEGNRILAVAVFEELRHRSIVEPDATWDDTAVARVAEQVNSRIDRSLHARQLRALAAMMGWLKQPVAARTQADLSLELSGRSEKALIELARGFEANGSAKLATEYYRAAVDVAPDSAQAHYRLAVNAIDTGQAEFGIEHLKTSVQLDPDFVDSQVRLGVALAMKGQWREAEERLVVAVELAPEAASVIGNLGLVVANLGRYPEAIEYYQKSLSLDNQSSSTHYNAGLAYEKLGQLDKAKVHYQATIRLANGHADAESRLRAILDR
jgi:tetratricopeptide (TPR) repeat protein